MKTKNLFRRFLAVTLTTTLAATFTANSLAQANVILFQDDTFEDVFSDALQLGSNDAGARNTSIRFGADVTGSENGNINWNITSNLFEFDHGLSVTGNIGATGNLSGVNGSFSGTLSTTGAANFSGASSFRVREVANEAAANCATAGELVMDTGENQLYICTASGTPGTWAATSGAADNFEQVYGADGDDTLTTADGNFSIATGTGEFDVTSTGIIDFNSASFTLDTTGAVAITSGAASNFTTTAGALTLNGAGGVNVAGNAAEVDVTTSGAVDINSGAFTIDGTTGSLDFTDTSNLTMTANNGADRTLTISSSNAGAGNGLIDISTDVWDITGAGAASGFTTIGASGNITTSGGTFVVGTTSLSETTSATDSGAFLVGINDEFTHSSSANVQDVMDDLDAQIATNATNITALQGVTGANAPNSEVLSFYPEYPNAVLFADTSNNSGTMSLLYDDTNDEHHYRWTSNQATTQDMDIKFRFSLPMDFVAFDPTNAFVWRYRTGTTTEADNDVEVRLYNATNSQTECHASSTNGNTSWTNGNFTATNITDTCTGGTALDPGDVVEVAIKLLDNSGAGDFADIGRLILNYTN